MIHVRDLTRRFSGMTAVDGITFSIDRGEIVGFLGPNGAGKTTTLRMLTCFLPPTSGSAEIAGFDISRESLGVRRNLGYLPESVPIYRDMRVDEYLRFRARIKGVLGKNVPERIRRVAEQCRIGSVRSRIVGQLSKGFRQRVGMADALINDPPILFLDEPTSGLDPNQIREVRDLIRDLGREKTLLISTHILPEVEATCKRVIIINNGRMVADEDLDKLKREGVTPGVYCAGRGASQDEMCRALQAVKGIREAKPDPDRDGGFILETSRGEKAQEAVYALFAEKGWTLTALHPLHRSLEEIFWHVTGFEVRGRRVEEGGDKPVAAEMEEETGSADTAEAPAEEPKPPEPKEETDRS